MSLPMTSLSRPPSLSSPLLSQSPDSSSATATSPQPSTDVQLPPIVYPTDDYQTLLCIAVQAGDLDLFVRALDGGADPSQKCDNSSMSVFDVCCRRPGMSAFIRECGEQRHTHYFPIQFPTARDAIAGLHLAAQSADAENLAALLAIPTAQAEPPIDINHLHNGRTALAALVASLSEVRFAAGLAAVRQLLENGADINRCDVSGVPPIVRLLRRASSSLSRGHQREVVELLLLAGSRRQPPNSVVADVDSHCNGEARRLLAHHFPDLLAARPVPVMPNAELSGTSPPPPPPLLPADSIDFDQICKAIRNRRPEMVVRLLGDGSVRRRFDKTCREYKNMGHAIGFAAKTGQYQILKLLMQVCPTDALAEFASKALIYPHNTDEKRLCAHRLLEVNGINVNAQDGYGQSALYMAVHHQLHDSVRQLLRRGARLGLCLNFADNESAIADIDAHVLADHLDERIISIDHTQRQSTDLIQMSYTNFVPVHASRGEMAAIENIVASPRLRHLAKHPLIASLLSVKRCRLSPLLCVNFGVLAAFAMALLTHVMWPLSSSSSSSSDHYDRTYGPPMWTRRLGLVPLILGGAAFLLLRESFKLLALPAYYARRLSTHRSLSLAALSIGLLIDDATANVWLAPATRRTLTAITILVVGWELLAALVALPVMQFSTHVVMLLKVARTFGQSLLVFSIVLVSFALCLCTLHATGGGPDAEAGDDGDRQFGDFGTPGLAIVRTLVMLTGEFDAGSIRLNDGLTRLVFVGFLLFVSIVMFNLLTGLAVSDTQEIRTDAEQTYWVRQAEMLIRYERLLQPERSGFCYRRLRSLILNRINVFDQLLPSAAINVRLNQNNLVAVPPTENDRNAQPLSLCGGLWRRLMDGIGLDCHCCHIESSIVDNALAIVQRKNRNQPLTATTHEGRRPDNMATDRSLAHIETHVDGIMARVEELEAHNSDLKLNLARIEESIGRIAGRLDGTLGMAQRVEKLDGKMSVVSLNLAHIEQSLGKIADKLNGKSGVFQ